MRLKRTPSAIVNATPALGDHLNPNSAPSKELSTMPERRDLSRDRFSYERRKIQASGILDALIEYAEGRREMSSSQVSAALGLLKKALPDLSTLALAEEADGARRISSLHLNKTTIEIRIVDPKH